MLSPGDDEVTEPRFIGHEYIYKHFTPEELDIELAYEGDIFQQLSYIYHAFRVGGYRGAPAAFAHVLPQGK
jgi:hypothetical protein